MKFRKEIIIFSLVVLLFAISAVSADENVTDEINLIADDLEVQSSPDCDNGTEEDSDSNHTLESNIVQKDRGTYSESNVSNQTAGIDNYTAKVIQVNPIIEYGDIVWYNLTVSNSVIWTITVLNSGNAYYSDNVTVCDFLPDWLKVIDETSTSTKSPAKDAGNSVYVCPNVKDIFTFPDIHCYAKERVIANNLENITGRAESNYESISRVFKRDSKALISTVSYFISDNNVLNDYIYGNIDVETFYQSIGLDLTKFSIDNIYEKSADSIINLTNKGRIILDIIDRVTKWTSEHATTAETSTYIENDPSKNKNYKYSHYLNHSNNLIGLIDSNLYFQDTTLPENLQDFNNIEWILILNIEDITQSSVGYKFFEENNGSYLNYSDISYESNMSHLINLESTFENSDIINDNSTIMVRNNHKTLTNPYNAVTLNEYGTDYSGRTSEMNLNNEITIDVYVLLSGNCQNIDEGSLYRLSYDLYQVTECEYADTNFTKQFDYSNLPHVDETDFIDDEKESDNQDTFLAKNHQINAPFNAVDSSIFALFGLIGVTIP